MTTLHGYVNHTKGVKTVGNRRGQSEQQMEHEREHDMSDKPNTTPESVEEPQVESTEESTVEPTQESQEVTYEVIEFDLTDEPPLVERFAAWAEFQATHATVGKGIRCSLEKSRGDGPYSDATFHTQMNLVLHNKELLKKFPHLVNLKLSKKNKITQLSRVR